jgi:uncharacterized protein (TIGR02391 family)
MTDQNDNAIYTIILWNRTLLFYMAALNFYEQNIQADVKAIDEDSDLKAILGEEERKSFKIYHELDHIKWSKSWVQTKLDSGKDHHFCDIAHSFVRFLKSVGTLYLSHLENRRNKLASRRNISKYVLSAVDKKISELREMTTAGVFKDASTIPLLVDEISSYENDTNEKQDDKLIGVVQPRPILIETIEIIDPDLRSRCLDLFNSFEKAGQRDRHDTVLTEATRIFEDKLRKISGAPQNISGVELAQYAFSGTNPKLVVSDIPAEQDAAHLLFRGIFGLLRNVPHHRLLGELQPERVLQVLGTLDYCLAVAQGARSSLEEKHGLSIKSNMDDRSAPA